MKALWQTLDQLVDAGFMTDEACSSWCNEVESQDSCDNPITAAYHEACHPALFIVELDSGLPGIRCYDCLTGPALEAANQEVDQLLGISSEPLSWLEQIVLGVMQQIELDELVDGKITDPDLMQVEHLN